jgi:hypothetical protein
VKFGKEFREEGRILAGNREHSKPTQMLRGTDIIPGYLALTTIASFIAGPKESTAVLIEGFDDPIREGPMLIACERREERTKLTKINREPMGRD